VKAARRSFSPAGFLLSHVHLKHAHGQRLALPLGHSPHWLKMKNPACAAVKREAEAFTYLVRVDSDAADQSRSG
jgi:hypothetical protein